MDRSMVTTTFGFEGYRIVRYLGVVRGITVALAEHCGKFCRRAGNMVGGKITTYTELCEHARQEAFDLLIEHAEQIGANAIIGMHYDATELMESVTEVLAYGTAVVVEKI